MANPDTRTRDELLAELKTLSARLEEMEQTAARHAQAGEILRDSERQSRAWLEHSPVCTKIVDLDFNLQYMSTAGVKELQIEDITEYYGKPYPFDFYPQSFQTAMTARLREARDTGQITVLEASVVDVNNRELWYHSTLVPVRDGEGHIDYIIVVSLEITERKQAEEQRVLLERQVQHAQKLESLGVLSGGIAHDFNNILVSILGNADLALHSLPADSPARANIEEVENASKRAAELAQQMLAYSGQGRFVTETIDLGKFVEEMIHLLQVSISRQAELKCSLADELPVFEGDATQIRQVIMNLITNASDALGDDRGKILVTTGATHYSASELSDIRSTTLGGADPAIAPGQYIWLEVEDSGCGMDQATVAKIFDPFFTTKVSGRGLGMSAVQGIIRGHGGTVSVRSQPAQGTTFRVLFPASSGAASHPTTESTPSISTEDWQGDGTILIVDDEEPVCDVGKLMLERLGFSVLTALDGRQALDILRDHDQAIVGILLDLTLPQLTGEEVLHHIRRACPDIPVILCSGYSVPDSDQLHTSGETPHFIQKPYSLTTLRESLMQVLDPATSESTCPDETMLKNQAAGR